MPSRLVFRPEQRDYGIDGEIEEFDESGEATGRRFRIQLKATGETGAAAMRERIKLSAAAYYRAQHLPVLMVRHVASSGRLYGRWFHEFDPYYEHVGETHLTFHWSQSNELTADSFNDLFAEVERITRLKTVGAQLPLTVAFEAPEGGVHGFARRGTAVVSTRAVLPVRAIYRRSLQRDELAANPTLRLALPAVRERRERVARPAEAEALLAALPPDERVVWATALYTGLRRGELQALHWDNLDLDCGLVHVEHSWDTRAGLIEPKSRSGRRRVPIPATLRGQLLAHHLRQGRPTGGFVFPNSDRIRPFDSAWATTKAHRRWQAARLSPIGLHECRHSYAAYAIAAGINPKALSSYMGHSSITVTLDRYGHLMPGNETQAAHMLDSYLNAENPLPAAQASPDHDRPGCARPAKPTAARDGGDTWRTLASGTTCAAASRST